MSHWVSHWVPSLFPAKDRCWFSLLSPPGKRPRKKNPPSYELLSNQLIPIGGWAYYVTEIALGRLSALQHVHDGITLALNQNRTIELIHKEGDEEAASSKLIDDPDFTDKLTEKVRKTFGLFLSLLSGLLYGANFFPITLSVEKDYFYSHLDATFSHFTGILGSHLIYFIIYSVYTHVSLTSWPQMTPKDPITGVP